MADQPPPRATRAFKPRAGVQRRTKAEREAFAAEEADREAKRAQEAAIASSKASKTSKRPPARKQDGTAAQNDSRAANNGDAGGVFGSAAAERPATRRILNAGSEELLLGNATNTLLSASSGAGLGTSAQRQRADSTSVAKGAAGGSVPLKELDYAIEDDDEPGEIMRDINSIGISTSEDDDSEDGIVGSSRKGKGKGKSMKKATQRPLYLRPLTAPIIDEPERYTADQKPKSALRAPEKPVTEAIGQDDGDTDEPELIKEQPSSPDVKRKTVKKPAGKTREVKLTLETPEERTERLRVADDVDRLRHIFAPDITDSTSSHDPSDRGKLFLLQFPPLIPMLVEAPARKPDGGDDDDDDDKNDGGDDDDDDDDADDDADVDVDGMVIVQVKQEDIITKPSTAADNKSKGPTIKKDPDAGPKNSTATTTTTTTTQDADNRKRVLTACSPLDQQPSGLVGKLNVHASGKITLDWAGTDMEVRLGTGVNFLQDALLLHTARTDEDARESTAAVVTTTTITSSSSSSSETATPMPDSGSDPDRQHQRDGAAQHESKAFALGQLDARMVVVPDWSKLYD